MSNIPEARGLIAEVIATATLTRTERRALKLALALMLRRPAARAPAPASSRVVGPIEAAAIRAWAHANPSKSLHDIAAVFNTNPGRVSEAMQGDR